MMKLDMGFLLKMDRHDPNVGWIKLYRSIWNQAWSNKPYYVALWVYILKKAYFEEREELWNGQLFKVQRGQFICGRNKMSAETGISASTIERILKVLESGQLIGQQISSTSRLITVINYEKYQDGGQEVGQRTDSGRTADGQRTDTIKEYKEDNNVNNDNNFSDIEILNHPLLDFIDSETPILKKFKDPLNNEQAERLERDFGMELIKDKLQALANIPTCLKKYQSVNLTIRNWANRKNNEQTTKQSNRLPTIDQLRDYKKSQLGH